MQKFSTLLVIIFLIGFGSGCTKNKITEKKLVGEWETTEWSIGNNNPKNLLNNDNFTSTIKIAYADNGTFDIQVKGNTFETTFTGTWNLSGERLEMNYDSADGVVGTFAENLSAATEIYTVTGITKVHLALRGAVEDNTVVVVNKR